MATTSDTTTNPTTTTTNGHGPATPAQLAALERFRATIPKGLTKGEASDWMDRIHDRLAAKERLTPEDLSGPPSFHHANDLPPVGRVIDYSTPAVPSPVPATGPIDVDTLPTFDAWLTVETEVEMDPGDGMHTRRYCKIAAHAAPGEKFEDALRRLMKKAEEGLWDLPEEEKPADGQ